MLTSKDCADEFDITERVLENTWTGLQRDVKASFACSDLVSPEHPCAAIVQSCDWQRLRDELSGHGRWVDGCYTRTTLMHDEKFVILLLCWPAGVCSPVHAHSDATTKVKSSCFMRILDGELTETLYPPDAIIGPDAVSADKGRSIVHPAGSYTYINDSMGLHKVGNASTSKGAVSLHIYAPGWQSVQLYDEQEPTDASGAAFDVDGWGD